MVTPLRTEQTGISGTRAPSRTGVPRTPGVIVAEKRFEASRVAVLLVLLAYGLVSLATDWWPIGWLNLAQQRMSGSYSLKLSLIAFLLIVGIVQTALWKIVQRVVTGRIAAADMAAGRTPGSAGSAPGVGAHSTAPGALRKPPMAQSSLLRWMGIGSLVLIWIIAPAVFFWFDTQQRNDNEATYVPLQVGDASPHVSLGDHVSVEGVVLASRYVTHRSDKNSSSPSYYLIPLVPKGWHPGDATHVLLQVDDPSVLPGYDASTPNRSWIPHEPVLGRVGSGASVIAASEFERMHVPLASGYTLLDVVPSQDGKPIQSHVDYLERVLLGAGVFSVMMVLIVVPSYFLVRRRERRELARRAAVPR